MRYSLNSLIKEGFNILYLDEVMFTYNTLYQKEYSSKGQNIFVKEKALEGKTRAVISCISEQKGLISGCRKISYFSGMTQKYLLGIENGYIFRQYESPSFQKKRPLIFNLPYSPEYNPIEQVFSLVKNHYKRKKINEIVRYEKFDVDKLIKDSFNQIKHQDVQKICQSVLNKINLQYQ